MAERSAAEQVKALVEAAEREARESREAVQRVAARADELSGRVDELAAGTGGSIDAVTGRAQVDWAKASAWRPLAESPAGAVRDN